MTPTERIRIARDRYETMARELKEKHEGDAFWMAHGFDRYDKWRLVAEVLSAILHDIGQEAEP